MDIHIIGKVLISNQLEKLDSGDRDFGVYQIYGHHPIYGNNVLLSFGLAQLQTFQERMGQEKWWWDQPDTNNIELYVDFAGRSCGFSIDKWNSMIDKQRNC